MNCQKALWRGPQGKIESSMCPQEEELLFLILALSEIDQLVCLQIKIQESITSTLETQAFLKHKCVWGSSSLGDEKHQVLAYIQMNPEYK